MIEEMKTLVPLSRLETVSRNCFHHLGFEGYCLDLGPGTCRLGPILLVTACIKWSYVGVA